MAFDNTLELELYRKVRFKAYLEKRVSGSVPSEYPIHTSLLFGTCIFFIFLARELRANLHDGVESTH